jgi:hypothetical protein
MLMTSSNLPVNLMTSSNLPVMLTLQQHRPEDLITRGNSDGVINFDRRLSLINLGGFCYDRALVSAELAFLTS